MRLCVVVKSAVLLLILAMPVPAGSPSKMQTTLPNPVLVLVGQEIYETGGKQWMRYKYAVDNLSAYPNEIFAAAPELPPCGQNRRASRTWVDFYDQTGKRLYGFCALSDNAGLSRIWFALEANVVPPSWVYIELTDRKTGIKYKSSLTETTL